MKIRPYLILIVLSVLASSPATSTLALDCPAPPSTTHFSSLSSHQRLNCMRPFKIADEKVECLKYCEKQYGNSTNERIKKQYDECVYACG
jgi:hypothetical protein